jgi:ribonuclease VapC
MILDASALLAYLQDEQGAETVADALAENVCSISTVNLAEVLSTLATRGVDPDKALVEIQGQLADVLRFEPFSVHQANIAASLRTPTRDAGLSLGDRACLALASFTGDEILTADHAWLDADGLDHLRITLIR